MTEHQEIFWSLFTVDMDATLAVQPPDTWESFQLFQLLNEYLSNDRKAIYLNVTEATQTKGFRDDRTAKKKKNRYGRANRQKQN